MKVGVVIPTCERPADLARCLASLARQTRLPHAVVIVDSGTERPAVEVAGSWGGRLAVTWRASARRSLPAQRNAGVAGLPAETDLVLFLDDDVVLENDYVERILQVFAADAPGRVGGVAGVSVDPPPSPERWWYRLWRRTFVVGLVAPARPGSVTRGGINLPIDRSAAAPQPVEWLFGCAAYRREVFRDAEFDEGLDGSALMEDVDFSYRVGQCYTLVVTPHARLLHRRSPANRPSAERFGRDHVRNRHWFLRKNLWSWRTAAAFWWTTAGYLLLWSASGLHGNRTARAHLVGALAGTRDVLARRPLRVSPGGLA
jgi:GT2 family glycosyltransferase